MVVDLIAAMKHIIISLVVYLSMVFAALTVSAQTSLTSLDGGKKDIEDQNGKVVVLAFGASWLPLSGKQAEYANSIAKKYAGKNVAVFFVMTDSNAPRSKNFASNEALLKFASANKVAVPVLRDPDGSSTFEKFGVDQVPSFVILDKNGRKVEVFGGIDPKWDITVPISRTIDRLL